MDDKKPKFSLTVVEEKNESLCTILNLPPEIVEKIFGHLEDFRDLCRAGRACKSWYEITRCRLFWRRISTNVSQSSLFIMERTFNLIRILPSCVTHINLNSDTAWYMNFRKFSRELRQRCPNLRTLILHRVLLKVDNSRIVDLFHDLPEDLRVLVLTHPNFFFRNNYPYKNPCTKIEVLSFSHCLEPIFNPYSFMHIPNLKKLHLTGCRKILSLFLPLMSDFLNQLHVLNLEQTIISSNSFETIRRNCLRLTELYVCWTKVKDKDLIFNEPRAAFPNLKVICFRGCNVTSNGIRSLIQSCPSLDRAFVGGEELNTAVDFAACNSDIVKVLNGFRLCNHNEKIDFMRE